MDIFARILSTEIPVKRKIPVFVADGEREVNYARANEAGSFYRA
jgi:hypothetical protein